MNMRLWSSRAFCTAVLILWSWLLDTQDVSATMSAQDVSATMSAQENSGTMSTKKASTIPLAQKIDWIRSLPKDTIKVTDLAGRDKRIHIRYTGANRIIPTMGIAQFAGNMGLVSVGAGWDHGTRAQWETSLLAGFIPKEEGCKRYITVTLKETYTPWSIQVNDRFSFEPLTCGLYLNSIISRDFWVREPDHYPNSYYGFSTKIRANVFIGESFTFYSSSNSFLRYTSLFYEFGTADMYIISKATNKYLKFWDIFGVSFGVKVKVI